MMHMWQLIKLQLKVSLGLSALSWYRRHKDKRFFYGIGLVLLVVGSLSPMAWLYFRLIRTAYFTALMLGQPEAVLTMSLLSSSFFVLFFGSIYVLSAFYFSRDLSFLIPLPLQPRVILAAKFAVVLVNNYIIVAPLFLPALAVFGLNQGMGPLYWLAGLAVFLFLPVTPLAVGSAAILLLMRVTNFSGRRDALRLLGLMLLMVILVAFNYFVTSIPPGEEADFIQGLIAGERSLVNFLARAFPPAAFATRALSAPLPAAALNFLIFTAASLAVLPVISFLADRLFYRGLIGGEEISARRSISARELDRKLARSSSPVWAIAMREIKILIRTPIYLFNSVGILVIVPVLLLVPSLARGGLAPLLQMFTNVEQRLFLNLGAAAFIGVMALFTPGASSSFSREGKMFWLSKVIPVGPAQQIKGKILSSYLLAFLAVPYIILFTLFAVPFSLSELLMVILLGAALSFPVITLSLLADLLRPYLDWDNPQKAIKQNLNVVLGMVAGGAALYLVYLAGRLVYAGGAADPFVYLAVLVASLILGAVPYAILMKIADACYQKTGT